jgi:hypothetical protein
LHSLDGAAASRRKPNYAGDSQIEFVLHAIEPQLAIDAQVRTELVKLTGRDGPSRPDVVLHRPTDPAWIVIECKAHSFSPESSNRVQALKILSASADMATAIPGVATAPSLVLYAVPDSEGPQMADALDALAGELVASGLATSDSGAMGLGSDADGVWLQIHTQSGVASGLDGQRVGFIQAPAGEDVRPLYLIPFDPDVEQSKELHDYGRAVLFTKVTVAAASRIGTETVPARIVLDTRELLSTATYGVFRKWRAPAATRVAQVAAQGLARKLRSLADEVLLTSHGTIVELTLADDAIRERVAERLVVADATKGFGYADQEELDL